MVSGQFCSQALTEFASIFRQKTSRLSVELSVKDTVAPQSKDLPLTSPCALLCADQLQGAKQTVYIQLVSLRSGFILLKILEFDYFGKTEAA